MAALMYRLTRQPIGFTLAIFAQCWLAIMVAPSAAGGSGGLRVFEAYASCQLADRGESDPAAEEVGGKLTASQTAFKLPSRCQRSCQRRCQRRCQPTCLRGCSQWRHFQTGLAKWAKGAPYWDATAMSLARRVPQSLLPGSLVVPLSAFLKMNYESRVYRFSPSYLSHSLPMRC